MASEITLKKLRASYNEWSGKPKRIIELRREQKSTKVPDEMDLLFFQPDEEDNLPEEEFFTSMATAGMSTRTMKGPYESVELVLRVQGKYPDKDLEAVARRLGELAVVPFREGSYFAPDMIIWNFEFPLFEKMNCLLITNVGVNYESWLPGISPPVLLLWVKPLFESEAKIAESIGDKETTRQFFEKDANWDDPQRSPVKLTKSGGKKKSKKKSPDKKTRDK